MKAAIILTVCILSACAAPKDPPFANTGAVITYQGNWGIADQLPSGMPGYIHHYGTLTAQPVKTPPLACKVVKHENGDVNLLPCAE